jgi:DNA-binding transcriptional LysR family regulator
MELRHLRYFVAVAEEGSLTDAAERRLHTAQPSLSRQIRDLELEVGVKLLERGARGIELTPAGRTFLDHARLALLQVEAAGEAARRAAQPAKATFMIGFLTGHEMVWLPDALRILREEEPGIEITLASQPSPDLAGALMRGKVDVAFLRREKEAPGITFKFIIKEPLVAMVPTGHRLASRKDQPAGNRGRNLHYADTLRAGAKVGDRTLHGGVRHYAEAGIRGRQPNLHDVARGLDGRRDRTADLCAPCVVVIRCPATAEREAADNRSGYGLQQVEHLAAVETVPRAS